MFVYNLLCLRSDRKWKLVFEDPFIAMLRVYCAFFLFWIATSSLLAQNAKQCFLELDRQVYQAGSTMWFSVSFWNENGIDLEKKPDHILFALVDEKKTVVDLHYFDTSDGLTQNGYYLPKKLRPGTYYTIVFPPSIPGGAKYAPMYRPIEVRKQLLSTVAVDHEWEDLGDEINLMVEVRKRLDERGLRSDLILQGSPNRVDWDSLAFARTNGKGNESVLLSQEVVSSYPQLRLQVRNALDTLIQSLRPPSKNNLQLEFYPAGGTLVYEKESTLAIRLLRKLGNPVIASGELKENDKVIGSFTTDQEGLAQVRFTPFPGKQYKVAVKSAKESTDRLLAPSLFGDYGMEVAWVSPDSVGLHLKSKRGAEQAVLRVFTETQKIEEIQLVNWAGESSLNIPVSEKNKILGFTLQVEDQVIATQKVVRAKPEDELNLQLELLEKPDYYQARDPVRLSVKLADSLLEKVFLNVKAVSYLNKKNVDKKDLDNFLRKARFLDSRELAVVGEGFYWVLEEQKGSWDGQLDAVSTPTLIEGNVFEKGQKGLLSSGPTNYMLISESGVYTQFTRQNGSFYLPVVELKTRPGEQLILKPSCSDCFVQLDNTKDHLEKDINTYLKGVSFSQPYRTEDIQFESRVKEQINLSSMNYLEEVVVTKRRRSRSAGDLNRFGQFMGSTGDYVCRQYGILNCINHRGGGISPEEGKYYRTNGGGRVLYRKPKPKSEVQDLFKINSFAVLEGFYPKQVFDSPDYSLTKENGVVDQRQTLFWNPAIALTNRKEKEITFYTADFPGIYVIDVVAFTLDGKSGSAQLEIKVY